MTLKEGVTSPSSMRVTTVSRTATSWGMLSARVTLAAVVLNCSVNWASSASASVSDDTCREEEEIPYH